MNWIRTNVIPHCLYHPSYDSPGTMIIYLVIFRDITISINLHESYDLTQIVCNGFLFGLRTPQLLSKSNRHTLQPKRSCGPTLDLRWANVCDVGPAEIQRWLTMAPCSPRTLGIKQKQIMSKMWTSFFSVVTVRYDVYGETLEMTVRTQAAPSDTGSPLQRDKFRNWISCPKTNKTSFVRSKGVRDGWWVSVVRYGPSALVYSSRVVFSQKISSRRALFLSMNGALFQKGSLENTRDDKRKGIGDKNMNDLGWNLSRLIDCNDNINTSVYCRNDNQEWFQKMIYTNSTQRLIFIHTRRESKSTLAGLFSVLSLCPFGVKVIIHANFLWYYSYQD